MSVETVTGDDDKGEGEGSGDVMMVIEDDEDGAVTDEGSEEGEVISPEVRVSPATLSSFFALIL